MQYCKFRAILFSENYLNKKTGEKGALSLFLDYWIAENEEIELNFSVFWMKKWNNLVLIIDSKNKEIILDRFLYNLEAETVQKYQVWVIIL